MMITVRHDHEQGTLIFGSCKGDGVLEVAKGYGFRWMPSIGVIGLRGSRDRVAKRHVIDGLAAALRGVGFEVVVEIDDTPRGRATVLDDKAGRGVARREALESKAQRRAAEAQARYAVADRIAKARGGQPILIGHHSEARGWADQRRIESNTRKGIELSAEARQVAARAAAVTDPRVESPRVTVGRIERAEAELRKIQRQLDGHTRRHLDHEGQPYMIDESPPATGQHRESLAARAAQLENQLAYDRAVVEAAKADGRYTEYGPADVAPGDAVNVGGLHWRRVVKVNRKTVSVETGYSWTDKVPFTKIRSVHRGDSQGE